MIASRIYLIGFMGSGKTTITKLLADQLNFSHLDTDNALEKLYGTSITAMFQENGEPWFRDEESKILKLTTQLDNYVISTGGGLPCFNNNIETINNYGTSIHIESSTGSIERLYKEKEKRPLIREFESFHRFDNYVSAQLLIRRPYYSKAQISITSEATAEHTVQLLIAQLLKTESS